MGEKHEPVPRSDGECHHDELGEDEGGEGDGNDVDELVVEENERSVHEDATLVDANQHPHKERAEVQ